MNSMKFNYKILFTIFFLLHGKTHFRYTLTDVVNVTDATCNSKRNETVQRRTKYTHRLHNRRYAHQ